jgi:membrane-bound lytic murein transglycosylase D
MNKIKLTVTVVAVILGFVCLSPSYLLASDLNSDSEKESLLSDDQLRTRVTNMSSMIELRYNRKIGNYIRAYVNNYGQSTDRLLGRVTNYFPIFESELRKRNLPQELKMLAVVESSLRPTVRSRVGAVGLWQFMHATGKQYGLTINGSVDERRDPFRSTEAAMDYLKDLHERFGDWTLALAAYNCGPGRVSKAMRNSGKSNYWDLAQYLPKETQNYVPKFIAAFYLMNYYYLHDISPAQPDIDLKSTSLTKIYEGISFDDISNMTGISMNSIEDMNPAFIRNFIPENIKGFNLILPEHSMFIFLENSGKVGSFVKNDSNGEAAGNQPLFISFSEMAETTIWVSRRTQEDVPKLDNLKVDEKQFNKASQRKLNIPDQHAGLNEKEKYETHRLAKGESILDIVSRRKDLELKKVLVLNDISLSRPPTSGTVIKLRRL